MHNVVAVAGGTNACWQGSGKSAKRVPSGIDTAVKTEPWALFFLFIKYRHDENGGHQAPVLFLQILPACGLALQGGQCQFDPFGILGVGLLEVFELGRDDGVILHIDKGAGQVGGEP